MIDNEEKKYWIVCFPKHETYKTLYNTEEGARKWVELRYPPRRIFFSRILAEMGGLRRIKKTKKSALK